jgi:hypothetical protein
MASEELDLHLEIIKDPLVEGLIIPFLGAGVNLCGRPADAAWGKGKYLPSGGELTEYLATKYAYPKDEPKDLLRVSQYGWVTRGGAPLYKYLREIFNEAYGTTLLHRFLARLPGMVRSKGYPAWQWVIVTTNYDDVLEQAFRAENELFDVVSYIADGPHRGKFHHEIDGALPVIIENPNTYQGLLIDPVTGHLRNSWNVILKIHGAVNRVESKRDSYVITEDHYIDYLTQTSDVSGLLPVPLPAKLRESHYLFLGYGLKDWNLRVILRRIWKDQSLSYTSWAIDAKRQPLEEKFWQERGVEIIQSSLEDYVERLGERIQNLSPAGDAR